jgi:prepilin-type N-terminal cleavage/methylation domain-containing protein
MKNFFRQNNQGFTLVEMMVAIAVFSIVMITAMSALLNVVDANNKARAIKTAINNVSFALEGISKDMRMGTDYNCGSGSEPDGDCLSGGNIIKYRSIRADEETIGPLTQYKYVYYKFDNDQLEECLEKDGLVCNYNGPFTPITSSEVKIEKAVFYVLGTDNTLSPKPQPRLILTVSGRAGDKEKISTEFDLQTSVSQVTR